MDGCNVGKAAIPTDGRNAAEKGGAGIVQAGRHIILSAERLCGWMRFETEAAMLSARLRVTAARTILRLTNILFRLARALPEIDD